MTFSPRSERARRRRPTGLAALCAIGLANGALTGQGTVNQSLLAPPPQPAVAAPAGSVLALVQQHQLAIVRVYVEVRRGRTPFPIERPGSAVIIDPRGLLLTWTGLVAEAASIADNHVVVQLGDAASTRLDAVIEGQDPATGLCLLRVAAPPGPLPFVEVACSAAAMPAEPAVVLARPEDRQLVAFAGVLGRAQAGTTLAGQRVAAADLLLTDARIDLRCHGAALLDRHGRLLGLCSAEHVRRDVQEPKLADLLAPSFGVALAADRLREALARLSEGQRPEHRTLLAAPAPREPSAIAAAVARAAGSIVAVHASDTAPDLGEKDPYATTRRPGVGSGVVLTRSGLVVTNRHLLLDRQQCTLRCLDGRTLKARVRGADASSNLALLQAELPAGAALVPIDVGGDTDGILAERVYAVGNPLGHAATVSAGVLSAVRAGGRLQTDARLGNANAGGALLDGTGKLLGIIDGGAIDPIELAFRRQGDQAKTETGLGICIDLATVRRVFAEQFAALDVTDEPFVRPMPVTAAELAVRRDATTEVAAATAPALLNVYISRTSRPAGDDSNPFAAHQPQQLRSESLGSGVVVTRSGLALTNWHVVAAAVESDGSARADHAVHVHTFDGRSWPCEVLSISREDDLALLQLVLPPGAEVAAIELGDSDALPVGAAVLACGNPLGFANTITAGIVTAKDQGIRVKGRWARLENLIETDAAINGGNSGGALLDAAGRLVGINSAGSHGFSARGYAIPVGHVRRQVLELLLSAYKLRSPDLGLRAADEDGAVVVAAVDPHGPAARAGIGVGTRIAAIGGTPVTWSPGFALLLRTAQPGIPLRLSLQQAGATREVDVVPLAHPVAAVQRQASIELSVLPFQQEPDRVRAAVVAMYRQFTGDAAAEPPSIQERVLRIERVHPDCRAEPPLAPGDLLLAVEIGPQDGLVELRRCTDVEIVQRLFNDRELGSYDGVPFVCWVQQRDAVRRVRLVGKRLLP